MNEIILWFSPFSPGKFWYYVLAYLPLIIIFPIILMMYNICSCYNLSNPFGATHKYKTLELGDGHVYNRSSVKTAVVALATSE
jgi:hypothetical protein